MLYKAILSDNIGIVRAAIESNFNVNANIGSSRVRSYLKRFTYSVVLYLSSLVLDTFLYAEFSYSV